MSLMIYCLSCKVYLHQEISRRQGDQTLHSNLRSAKKIIQDNKGKTSKNMSSCVTILYQSFKWRLTETLEHFMKHCIPRRAELNVPDTVQHDLLYWAATEMSWPAAVMWMPCPRTRLGQICDSKEKWNFIHNENYESSFELCCMHKR